MLEFALLARGLYRANQLSVTYDPTLRMPSTPGIQAWMTSLWEEQVQQARRNRTRLFDAPLFRFIAAIPESNTTLHLVVSDTSYKEYVTTRVPAFAQGRAREELGNALGVCSVVETSDGYILLDKRQGVDVYVGRYHVIGGFFERHLDTAETQPDPFTAIRREIREETGVQEDDISEQYCLCVAYDLTTPHAELCFLTRLHIPLATVLQRVPEDDEVKQLLPLQVNATSLREFILHHHGNISATGEPNLLCYGAWKFGETWYHELMKYLDGEAR